MAADWQAAGAPYDPASLTAPLGPKRVVIEQWEESKGSKASSLTSLSDSALISRYTSDIHMLVHSPGNPLTNLVGKGVAAGAGIDNTVTGGITSALDFLNKLADPHLWLRVGEVVLGLLLIGVGAAKLSGAAKDIVSSIPLAGKAIAE